VLDRSAIRLVLKDIKQAHHVVGESQDDRRDVEQEVPMPTAASTRSQDKKTRKKRRHSELEARREKDSGQLKKDNVLQIKERNTLSPPIPAHNPNTVITCSQSSIRIYLSLFSCPLIEIHMV